MKTTIHNIRPHGRISVAEYSISTDSGEVLEHTTVQLAYGCHKVTEELQTQVEAYIQERVGEFEAMSSEELQQHILFTAEEQWQNVKAQRNALLKECDWTQLHDAPLTAEKKAEYQAYRQQLRDIPQTYSTPDEVVFPAEPK